MNAAVTTGAVAMHTEVMARIARLQVDSPTAAVSTAKAYVDTLHTPVRTSSQDLQNLIDAAETQGQDITRALKSLRRTLQFLRILPAWLYGTNFVTSRVESVADTCRELVRDCSVPVASYGVVAAGATEDAQTAARPAAELLESSAAQLEDGSEVQTILSAGARTLYDNSDLLNAQASLAENLRAALMTAVRQLQEASTALREVSSAARTSGASREITAGMRREQRRVAMTRGRVQLLGALHTLSLLPQKVLR